MSVRSINGIDFSRVQKLRETVQDALESLGNDNRWYDAVPLSLIFMVQREIANSVEQHGEKCVVDIRLCSIDYLQTFRIGTALRVQIEIKGAFKFGDGKDPDKDRTEPRWPCVVLYMSFENDDKEIGVEHESKGSP